MAAALVASAAPTYAAEGISGKFELYYARQPAGSAEPSYSVTIPGIFASSGSNFVAEAAYPLPGGGTEKVRLLLLNKAQKNYLLYPETMNYRRINAQGKLQDLLATISETVRAYFTSTPESLGKRGIVLTSQGRATVNGERLLAYKAVLPSGKEPAVKDSTGLEWRLTLYFSPKDKRLKILQVKAPENLLRLRLMDIKKTSVKPSEFIVPNGYYQTEEIKLGSDDGRDDGH